MTNSGMRFTIQSDFAKFARAMQGLEKDAKDELNRELRSIGKPILAEVRREALAMPSQGNRKVEGPSLRRGLAGAAQLQLKTIKSGGRVRIRVSGSDFAKRTGKPAKLPRYVEGLSRRRWRHPVFASKGETGGTWKGKWVEQEPRPFLIPTVLRFKPVARKRLLAAYERAYNRRVRRSGL